MMMIESTFFFVCLLINNYRKLKRKQLKKKNHQHQHQVHEKKRRKKKRLKYGSGEFTIFTPFS